MEKSALLPPNESDRVPAITLALRGERVPLHNAVSSVYNSVKQHLLVASGPALYLYGKLLETGGELLATLQAETNVQFQFVLYLAWLDVYSVIATETNGRVQHRIVSTDLKTSVVSHVVTDGTFFTAIANVHRRELITADSDGGLKAWALRASTSSAAAAGGLKGILRAHTATGATRKPMYRQFCLNANGQKILASTTSRIHIIDSAMCTLQSSCFKGQSSTIERMEYGVADDCLYVVFQDSRRKISKFQMVQKKTNEFVLKKISERDESNNSVAFCCTDNSAEVQRAETPDLAAGATIRGLFVLDDCGQLLISNFVSQRQQVKLQDGVTLPQLNLQVNSLAERYVALHSELRPRHRNLLFLVCASGFCIIEVFLPSAEGRLVVTISEGELMKKLSAEADSKISIYQTKPIPRIMLLDSDNRDFCYVQLRVPGILQTTAHDGSNNSSGVRLVDISSVGEKLAVLWSNGTAQWYFPSDDRVRAIVQVDNSEPRTNANAMVVLRMNTETFIAFGDSRGTILIVNATFEATQVCGIREAHTERISALCSVGSSVIRRASSLSLASVSFGGEVKVWLLTRADDLSSSFNWELQVCFCTHSYGVSAVCLLHPEFLFCGFESGGVECWRLPSASTSSQGQQQHSNRIVVVKRPLHSIDIHLTSVQHIKGEAGGGHAVLQAQQPSTDAFSWMVSSDQDGIVLIWYFSLELFFPHRRIKVHDCIRGCFLSDAAAGFVQLFAYVGTCVELLDQLTQGDRDAVKERVKWGREVSRKRKQESVVQYTTNVAGTQSGDRAESSTPGLLNQGNDSLIDSMTAAVRIRIILPGVDGKEQRQRSDSRSPTKRPTTSRPAHIDMELPLELDDKSDSSVRVSVPCQAHPSQSCPPCLGQKESSSKHDYSVPAPPTLHTPELVAEQTFISKVETEAGRAKNDTTKQIFVSSLSSVPSSFNKAKPRVYRNRFNPTDAMKKQTQCNVISSGESTAEADNKFCFAETSNQITTRNSIVISKQGVRAECGPQEKVSVVSLADLDDESVLMLDFRATSRPRRQISSNEAYERAVKGDTTQFNVRFLAWSGLTEAQRRLELMAATKSRCVQEDAARDEIIIPSLKDFDSSEVKVQLSVHAFARWFSALQNQHQWIRERFLLEELVFVAEESTVHSEMVLKGLPVPSSECIGVSSSREWYAFVLWYSYGRQSVPGGGDTENPTLFKERLEARGHFLKQRLQIVEDVERKLVEDKLLAGAERRAFIFEHFKWPSSEESENAMSWEHTSLANREKEVALALLDPDIHIVAMTQEIELPDLSGASLDDFDLLALAGKFVPWWKAAGNKLRQEFLNKEVEEAAADASIRELLAQELGDEDGAELSSEDFLKAYLKSDQARLTFLKRKLFYMKRKSRIASVAKYGKPPAPIVFETLPRPLSVPFRFPDLEPPPAEEETETKEDSLNRLADENSAEEKLLITETADKQAEDDKLIRLDGEEELKKTALELEMMTVEDALSREYNAQMVEVESDDDDNGKPLTPPKRTDFSHSYFFGNLPQRFRIPQSGWHSGSGIDNGDEEIEEEEQLEQERERQRLLDLQEAERLAEEEKRAERARIEKEQEDKALQMRRVHQVELRKVLIHQSELEAKRRAERELRCISSESEKMLAEEIKEKQRLEQLVREQLEMEREDQLSSQLRKELRDATARAKRLQLSEQALMRAEDNRSQVVEKERMLRERDEEERRVYLTELYTSFEPFFASTNEPSEEFLPSIQRRCLERERRKRVRVKTAPYTVPYAETLVMDEVQQEPYLARDSRKFNTLIGLPVRSSHGRVRTAHIPSENEIVRLQRKAQLLDDEDRVETPLVAPPASPSLSPSPLPALAPQRLRQKTRARHKKPQLPDLVSWKESSEMLTDINEACNTLSPEAKRSHHTKTKASESSNQRQQAALPFFRGNMVIRGESKPTRAKDYSYRS